METGRTSGYTVSGTCASAVDDGKTERRNKGEGDVLRVGMYTVREEKIFAKVA